MQARVESEVAATTARKGTETCVSPECLAIPGQMAALRELFARAPHPFSVTMLTPIGYGGLRELQEQLRNVERGIVAPRENAERRRLALRARRAECVRAVARIMSAGVAPGGAAVMDSLVLR